METESSIETLVFARSFVEKQKVLEVKERVYRLAVDVDDAVGLGQQARSLRRSL
jgi:hypothetical protein